MENSRRSPSDERMYNETGMLPEQLSPSNHRSSSYTGGQRYNPGDHPGPRLIPGMERHQSASPNRHLPRPHESRPRFGPSASDSRMDRRLIGNMDRIADQLKLPSRGRSPQSQYDPRMERSSSGGRRHGGHKRSYSGGVQNLSPSASSRGRHHT
eukprot:UN08078